MEFITKSIKELHGADYNPRVISDESFIKLKESLKTFGVCKPVIANSNGILIAGHQRTKAMKEVGITEVPCYINEKKIAIHDEIRFNLFHNSIETENSNVSITQADELPFGYAKVESDRVKVKEFQNGAIVKEICRLLSAYGEWGSVIINEEGNVIHNADYGAATKLLNMPCLVYKMKNEQAESFLEYMKIDYGRYNYEALGIKAYNQTHCQMSRAGRIHSRLYERYVIPQLSKEKRMIDFGAGKMQYVQKLQKEGYKAFGYEPHYKKEGTTSFDVRAVVRYIKAIERDIRKNGLFDICVLDSVLNSITNNDFEHAVMLSCNSLMKEDGICYIGTRSIKQTISQMNSTVSAGMHRRIEFLDKDNYSAVFRQGVWTLQKFNDKDSLYALCKKYFKNVKVYDTTTTQLFAICKEPIQWDMDEYKRVLNLEWNMEYPNEYRHNQHEGIVKEIMNRVGMRGKDVPSN